MDGLLEEHEKLVKKGNLSKSVEDVQKTIDLLVKARDSIAFSMSSIALCSPEPLPGKGRPIDILLDQAAPSITLAKLQNPIKQSFDTINSDLKEVYNALSKYTKALDKVDTSLNIAVQIADAYSAEIQRQALAKYRL